jgi:hypothetical protein
MSTPVHPAAVHGVLGTHGRMIIAMVIAVVAVAAAVITLVLLQSGTTAPTLVDDEPASVGGTAPEWLQDYRFGSADSAERLAG